MDVTVCALPAAVAVARIALSTGIPYILVVLVDSELRHPLVGTEPQGGEVMGEAASRCGLARAGRPQIRTKRGLAAGDTGPTVLRVRNSTPAFLGRDTAPVRNPRRSGNCRAGPEPGVALRFGTSGPAHGTEAAFLAVTGWRGRGSRCPLWWSRSIPRARYPSGPRRLSCSWPQTDAAVQAEPRARAARSCRPGRPQPGLSAIDTMPAPVHRIPPCCLPMMPRSLLGPRGTAPGWPVDVENGLTAGCDPMGRWDPKGPRGVRGLAPDEPGPMTAW